MSTVIVINGSGGVGKSTFVRLCHDFDHSVIELSMVDFVKDVARYAGWDGVKDDKGRKFLSDLKDAMDGYRNLTRARVTQEILDNQDKIVFVNAREPKDIAYLVASLDATTVLIERNTVAPITTNHADAGVNDYTYDHYIKNNGNLDDLRNTAFHFMMKLKENM